MSWILSSFFQINTAGSNRTISMMPIGTASFGASGQRFATMFVDSILMGDTSDTGGGVILNSSTSGSNLSMKGDTSGSATINIGPSVGGMTLQSNTALGSTVNLFSGSNNLSTVILGNLTVTNDSTSDPLVNITSSADNIIINMGNTTQGGIILNANVSNGGILSVVASSRGSARINVGTDGFSNGDVQINSGSSSSDPGFGNTPNIIFHGTTTTGDTDITRGISIQWYDVGNSGIPSLAFASDTESNVALYAGSYNDISNVYLKENIEKVDYLAMMNDFDVYSFNFKGNPNKRIGILAQEVDKAMKKHLGNHCLVVNDLKPDEEDGPKKSWHVNSAAISMIGLGALKQYMEQMNEEIQSLKARIVALESR